MASENVLTILSTWLWINVLLLNKITLNYYYVWHFLRATPYGASFFWLHSSPTITTCSRTNGSLRCCWTCFRKPDTKCCHEALSVFGLCTGNFVLKNIVRNLLQHQATFMQSLHCVQKATHEKFFLPGTEIADTLKSVEALRDVIGVRLTATGETFSGMVPS